MYISNDKSLISQNQVLSDNNTKNSENLELCNINNMTKPEIIIKYYKDKQSHINQVGYFRSTHNQIRKDKNTKKFKKINTTKYSTVLQEYADYNDYEYTCTGLNSHWREMVVIDSDDNSFGKVPLLYLKEANLEPNLQKVKKSNGHSQTYFLIEPYQLSSGRFVNGKYVETKYWDSWEKWKALTKMMNHSFGGDICYTGYNCQNPFYEDENTHTDCYHDLNKRYTFDELYDFMIKNFYSDVTNINLYLAAMRKKALARKSCSSKLLSNLDKQTKIIIKYLNTENTNKLPEGIVREIISETSKAFDRSINERIFVTTSKICKSFWMRDKLNYDNLEEISKTVFNNYMYEDNAEGYTTAEVIQRINNDVIQIIRMNDNNEMQWDKVGYTKKQREISLKIRQNKMNQKISRFKDILIELSSKDNISVFYKKNGSINLSELSKYAESRYYILFNEHLNIRVIEKYLKNILNSNPRILLNKTISDNNKQKYKIDENTEYKALTYADKQKIFSEYLKNPDSHMVSVRLHYSYSTVSRVVLQIKLSEIYAKRKVA